ncbi:MAG: HlyD family efflux transporter periplasmic adaptor subunit [Candidatus Paceibacterota bacterium]|jgi:multidrug resistance efflux pump
MEPNIKKALEMEEGFEEKIKKEHILKTPWIRSSIYFVVIFGLLGIFLFWQTERGSISVENSYLDAPIVNLTPTSPGTLNALYVKEGDRVQANSQIALVGSQIIYTKEGGIISSAPLVLGSYYSPGQTVVSVVSDEKMRVIGKIEETKGLDSIKVGQRATFTVDTFPSNEYEGIVYEISPVSNNSGILFSISDKRPVNKFNVYVTFDVSKYPELKSGMSAKLLVYIR